MSGYSRMGIVLYPKPHSDPVYYVRSNWRVCKLNFYYTNRLEIIADFLVECDIYLSCLHCLLQKTTAVALLLKFK